MSQAGRRVLTSAVKVLVPEICAPAAGAKVNVADFKSRVVDVATSSTSKPVEVTLVI